MIGEKYLSCHQSAMVIIVIRMIIIVMMVANGKIDDIVTIIVMIIMTMTVTMTITVMTIPSRVGFLYYSQPQTPHRSASNCYPY